MILSRGIPQPLSRVWVASHPDGRHWVRLVWLIAVVCGCLGLLGVAVSTVSAQLPPLACPTRPTGPAHGQYAAKRRRSGSDRSVAVGVAASYSRYSSSLQREDGIDDQQRICRERAEQDGFRIAAELEFSDKAVSGTKRDRAGLNAMIDAARQGKFEVLYLFSLSRLARESVITMPLLKQLVHNHGIRIISISEGIDTAQQGWELIASILALQHERYIKDLGDNVFRGQEGAVLAGRSVGDYCFGYSSVPLPGGETSRRSRHAKPPMGYIIDPENAAWVLRIYYWYVVEGRSLSWIARELNRLNAPKDHRATTPDWHPQYLSGLLANRKYIGIWPWGEKQNVRDPLTGDVSQEPRSEVDCEKWLRHFPELRIIPDEMFAKAQERLAKNKASCAAGRNPKGKLCGSRPGFDERAPRHLLSGLIECAECGSRFHVGGSHGKYLFCPKHKRGTCTCQTKLQRARAERMILAEVGNRILGNPEWTTLVVETARQAILERNAATPTEWAQCQRQFEDVERKISRLVDSIESGASDPEVSGRLAERRSERRELKQRLETLALAKASTPELPTEASVRVQLANLGDLLTSSTPAAAEALRNLLGGRVVVTEIRREGRSRHHLQGRFTIEVGRLTHALLPGMERGRKRREATFCARRS